MNVTTRRDRCILPTSSKPEEGQKIKSIDGGKWNPSVGTACFISFLKIYRGGMASMDISVGCVAAGKYESAIVIIGRRILRVVRRALYARGTLLAQIRAFPSWSCVV